MFFCFSLCSLLVLSFCRRVQVWNVIGIFRLNTRGSSAHGFFGESTVLASRADGTVRSYLGGYKRWKCWASSNHVCHFPPNPFQVAVYLQCLLNEADSPSPVLNAVYSIDWVLQLAGLSKISIHPLVASMVSASQRILGRSSIFLESSNCDQFRDGAWIVIARTDLPNCPVKALEDYISAAQINLSEDLPLFRALATPRAKEKVRSQGISYTRARELIKDAFRDITDVSKISVHSLRVGGATSAANAGIADRLFKRHGRWASENVKDG